jgi:hypothetical protein
MNTAQNMTNTATPHQGKQSAVFRDFIKFVQKTGKQNARKIPDYREVLKSPEYRNYDIRKALNVEVREWTIPLGSNEEGGIRMLVFVIPKNQAERKVQDEMSLDKLK